MPSKDQLSEQLNEKMDTSIDWSRLTKEDLEHLNMMVDEGLLLEPLAKNMAKQKGSSKLEEEIDDWSPGKLVAKIL